MSSLATPLNSRVLYAGGLPVLEITLRTPLALPAIELMRKAVPEAVVGVGTLTRAEQCTVRGGVVGRACGSAGSR